MRKLKFIHVKFGLMFGLPGCVDTHLDLFKWHVEGEGLVVIRVQRLLFNRRLPLLPLPLVQSQLHLHIRIYRQQVEVKFMQTITWNIRFLCERLSQSDLSFLRCPCSSCFWPPGSPRSVCRLWERNAERSRSHPGFLPATHRQSRQKSLRQISQNISIW